MYIDEIRKKRQQMQDQQRTRQIEEDQKTQSESLKTAVKENEATTVGAASRTTDAVNKSKEALSKELQNNSKDITEALTSQNQNVSEALNNLVVATVMARDPELINLINNYVQLLDNLSASNDKLANSPLNEIPKVNKQIVQALKDFNSKDLSGIDYTKKFKSLEDAVKAIDFSPNITVKPTPVTIPPVDLSGVSRAISDLKETGIQLENYRAQDLEDGDTFQYVGMLNPDGQWYIIENDIAGNSLRYVFGSENYMEAWANHGNLQYQIMSDAINEVQA